MSNERKQYANVDSSKQSINVSVGDADTEFHTSATLVREDMYIADEVAANKDAHGFTHPNLHRRIDTPPDGSINRKYAVGIYGADSYRTIELIAHDEESTTSEIP